MGNTNTFSRVILWTPLLFLFIFSIDIFFAVPNADDYDFFIWIERFGFYDFQKYMYLHQNGRFVSSFFVACYSALFNAVNIYWIFPFLFFIALYISIVFLIRVCFKYLIFKTDSFACYSYAAWIMLLFILVCRELSSFIFWMPGVITYQLPFTFLILGINFIVKFSAKNNKIFLIASLCCFALASGCHELIFLLLAPTFLLFGAINFNKVNLRNISLLILFSIFIPFLISIYSPGTGIRAAATGTVNVSFGSSVSGAILREVFLFSRLLTVPYLYIVLAIVFLFFNKIKTPALINIFKRYPLYIIVVLTLGQPLFIYFITVKSFNSGLPERAENLLLIQSTIFLLLIAANLGVNKLTPGSLKIIPYLNKGSLLFLIALCMCSSNFKNGIQAVAAGYFYKQIAAERIKNIKSGPGPKVLSLTDYEDELKTFYKYKYDKEMPDKFLNIAKRNEIILFRDVYDLLGGQNKSFRQYYKIDTLKTPATIAYEDTLIYLPSIKNGQ